MERTAKLIFLDIDGTIRNFDGSIPESAIRAVRRARENGNQVMISSGRSLSEIEREVLEIGFDGIIAGSGSIAVYQGKTVLHRAFRGDLGYRTADWLLKRGAVLELITSRKGYFLNRQNRGIVRLLIRAAEKKAGISGKNLIPMPEMIDSPEEVRRLEKIIYMGPQISEWALERAFPGRLNHVELSVRGGSWIGGEITPRGVDKGAAVRRIAERAGFLKEDLIAIGDSENDGPMFRAAGISVAMRNGSRKAREAADLICPPLTENGLYRAFQALGLI